MTALVWLDTFVLALIVLLVAGVLRSHAEIIRTLHAAEHDRETDTGTPRIGSEPTLTTGGDVVGVSPDQEKVRIPVGGSMRPTLLAFLTSGCLTCHGFWHVLGQGPSLPRGGKAVIVTKGPSEEAVSKGKELSPTGVPVVMSSEAWSSYGVPGAPYFVWVDSDGVIKGVGTGTSWESIEKLLEDSLDEADEVNRTREEEYGQLAAAGIYPGHPSLHDPLRLDDSDAGI
jgi:hypothetical protein